MEDRLWTSRLRWRLHGAWRWPAFALLTLGDAVLLHRHPIAGDRTSLIGGLLLAVLVNLGAVVLLAPLLARRLRRAVPREIADDRAGTAMVLAVAVVVAVLGAAHAGAVGSSRRDLAAQFAAAHRYFAAQAPEPYRRHLGQMSTWVQGAGLYRTCIPGADGDHALCVFVSTASSPPGIRLDPDHEPNSVLAGPDNPGRR